MQSGPGIKQEPVGVELDEINKKVEKSLFAHLLPIIANHMNSLAITILKHLASDSYRWGDYSDLCGFFSPLPRDSH